MEDNQSLFGSDEHRFCLWGCTIDGVYAPCYSHARWDSGLCCCVWHLSSADYLPCFCRLHKPSRLYFVSDCICTIQMKFVLCYLYFYVRISNSPMCFWEWCGYFCVGHSKKLRVVSVKMVIQIVTVDDGGRGGGGGGGIEGEENGAQNRRALRDTPGEFDRLLTLPAAAKPGLGSPPCSFRRTIPH